MILSFNVMLIETLLFEDKVVKTNTFEDLALYRKFDDTSFFISVKMIC